MGSTTFNDLSFENFKWLNEPKHWKASKEMLEISTDDKTDFWQKTQYGFAFNSGHLFGVEIKENFTLEVCIEANFTTLYDQAGLMIYIDEQHWLKTGIEYNDGQPMIGSVLTNGVSDWATDIPESREIDDSKYLPRTCLTSSQTNLVTPSHGPNLPDSASHTQMKIERCSDASDKNVLKKEYEDKNRRADEIHELETQILNENLREAKAKADLAEFLLQQASKGVYPGNSKKFYLRVTRLGEVVCVKYSPDNVTWTLLRLSPFPAASTYFVGPMACTPQREGLEVKFSNLKFTEPAEDILHSN